MNIKDSRFAMDVFDHGAEVPVKRYEDPLDQDTASDIVVSTTRRGLCRLTLLAAEVGARFERDGEMLEPMAWLLAPRELFNGEAAIDACLQRDHFLRALLLHGLAIGLDADPAEIDHLLDDQDLPFTDSEFDDAGQANSSMDNERARDVAQFASDDLIRVST